MLQMYFAKYTKTTIIIAVVEVGAKLSIRHILFFIMLAKKIMTLLIIMFVITKMTGAEIKIYC